MSENGSVVTSVADANVSFEGGAALPALGRASASTAMAKTSAERTARLLRIDDTSSVDPGPQETFKAPARVAIATTRAKLRPAKRARSEMDGASGAGTPEL